MWTERRAKNKEKFRSRINFGKLSRREKGSFLATEITLPILNNSNTPLIAPQIIPNAPAPPSRELKEKIYA